MAKSYCVFWLPRMYHMELAILESVSNTIQDEISDEISPDTIHHVCIEIDVSNQENRNIKIRSTSGTLSNAHEVEVILEYVDSSRNGLIQYYYETDNRNKEAKYIFDAVPNAIYHLIKSFFHIHEYHHPQGDSTLTAYVSKYKIDIKEKDNKALTHYLEQYEDKFKGYRGLAFDKLLFIEKADKQNAEEWYHNYLKRHKLLDLFCDNALGESLYYETLLYSWYNDSCKHDHTYENNLNLQVCEQCTIKNEECKKLHRLALNTKNAIDSIRLIKTKNKYSFDYKNSEYTLQALKNIQTETELKAKLLGTNTEITQNIQDLIRKGDSVTKTSFFVGIVSVILGAISIWLALR